MFPKRWPLRSTAAMVLFALFLCGAEAGLQQVLGARQMESISNSALVAKLERALGEAKPDTIIVADERVTILKTIVLAQAEIQKYNSFELYLLAEEKKATKCVRISPKCMRCG